MRTGAGSMVARVLTAVGLALLAVLLPVSVSWAAHAPAPLPSLAPGETAVATGWTCHGTTSGVPTVTADTCHVAGWAVMPAPAAYPTHPAYPVPDPYPTVVGVYGAGAPLPVLEQSPQATSSAGDTVNCLSSPDSPSSSASPDGTGSPEPSPSSEAATSTASICELTTTLASGQALGLWLFLGALVMLGVYALLRREGRGFRVG